MSLLLKRTTKRYLGVFIIRAINALSSVWPLRASEKVRSGLNRVRAALCARKACSPRLGLKMGSASPCLDVAGGRGRGRLLVSLRNLFFAFHTPRLATTSVGTQRLQPRNLLGLKSASNRYLLCAPLPSSKRRSEGPPVSRVGKSASCGGLNCESKDAENW